jgi:hypothetical protein
VTLKYGRKSDAETKQMEALSYGGEYMEQNKSNTGVALNPNDAGQQEDGTLCDKADKTNGLIGAAMSLLSHLIFVVFTIYITFLCFEDYSLFSWHPTCMTVGVS